MHTRLSVWIPHCQLPLAFLLSPIQTGITTILADCGHDFHMSNVNLVDIRHKRYLPKSVRAYVPSCLYLNTKKFTRVLREMRGERT
ncbi:hypothetical protein BDM02DRAFT_1522738 [Thelephora ganbajun]|uniref:Uncharacterized protein n=1 Tax=Thelephora ganbajun TaxID=370292 RepID=A0ACB6ZLZ1_THEGA|nr:hypothetical protein BDM02DRAFT_1522738 [Thelephora ganbajun]